MFDDLGFNLKTFFVIALWVIALRAALLMLGIYTAYIPVLDDIEFGLGAIAKKVSSAIFHTTNPY